MIFDYLQIALWSLTYVLVIKGGQDASPRMPCMPLVAGCLNFCWEVNALIFSGGMWGHILWLTLDAVILFQNMRYLHSRFRLRGVLIYSIAMILMGMLLAVLFRIPEWNGMLYTAFADDLIMAAEFVIAAKKITPNCKVSIAVCKLFGDLFAWLFYCKNSMYVAIIGAIVLALNLFYLCWCIEVRGRTRKKVRKH